MKLKNPIVLTSLIILLANYQKTIECFNFDVTAPVFKQINSDEQNNKYFGYSVAQHSTKIGNYILVGAPRDNFKEFNRSGAIYKCPLNLDLTNDCEQIEVNFNSVVGDQSHKKNFDRVIKEQFVGTKFDDQWFGVSLSSTVNGSFSACAHKYVHYYNFTKRDEHMAYGACFTFANDFVQEYKHVPCLIYTHETGLYHANNYAYCQAGTSMLMSQGPNLGDSYALDATDTFISYGMPSALNFRGLIGLRNSRNSEFIYGNSSLCRFNPLTDSPGYKGQGYCNELWEKYSYLGMSHAVIASYQNNRQTNVIAAGAPRDQLNGVIRFFTNTYDPQFGGSVTRQLETVLTGPENGKGSYYGFSMAACDVDGDGAQDLIVGAPYFTKNKFEPNSGSIYVYLNHKTKGFTNEPVFNYTGSVRSLFGHSITCVGDIDKDGFQDFAIGAPYHKLLNSQSSGTVYIFRGHSDPKNIKLSQSISADQFSEKDRHLKGFGYSLSGGMDMDANNYPDLVVGVLQSNAVAVLRTRPTTRIETLIQNNENLQIIDQRKKECSLIGANGRRKFVSCFPIRFCARLTNLVTARANPNAQLNFSIIAEPDLSYSRVFFTTSNSRTLNSSMEVGGMEELVCTSVEAVFKKDNYDFITPIEFVIRYKFGNENDQVSRVSLGNINNFPIVHEDSSEFKFKANFKTECAQNRTCLADLKLSASFVNLTVDNENVSILSFKESDSISLVVRLENTGELAYATAINIGFDNRLDYIRKDDLTINSFNCAQNTKNSSNLVCKMTTEFGGVPFPANYSVKFVLTFSSTRLYRSTKTSQSPDVVFSLNATTLSTDINPANNQVKIFARFKVRANLFLYGRRTPEQLFFGDGDVSKIRGESAIQSLEQIGPIIEHTYKINNGGPFSIQSFQLVVEWPHETRLSYQNTMSHGKHLLYLVERPTKIPNNHPINVICSSYEVDPLNLARAKSRDERQKKRKRDSDSIAEYELVQKMNLEQPSERTAVIDCFSGNAFCQKIVCNFYGDLNKGETISLKFTARVWNATLVEDYKDYEKVLIKSYGKLLLSSEVHDDDQSDNSHSVVTLAYSNMVVQTEKKLPIWVYISSVLIGLALLLLITVAFWMIGFFERKKYGDDKYLEESNSKLVKTPY